MVVIISNKVLDSIYDYAKSLTNYPICSSRARQKVDKLISALNALGSSISTPSVCMNKDLLQTFDRQGNPINKNLKRFNYKDESNFQWAFACLYDYENDTIIVLKMMPATFIKETLADRINFIVEKNLNNFAMRITLLENNNTKTQYKMKQRIRLTEGDLHRIIKNCVNEALNELDWKTYASAAHKARAKGDKRFVSYSKAAKDALKKKFPNAINQNGRTFEPIMVDGEMGYKAKHSGKVIGTPNTYEISDENYGLNGGFGTCSQGFDENGKQLYSVRDKVEYPFTPNERKAVDDMNMFYRIGDLGYTKGKGWDF